MRLKVFLVFLYSVLACQGQEIPPIQNYLPNDYGADNQNWSVSQAGSKYMYFGNNAGLLEFNGASWKLYPSPNGTVLRSVKAIGNLIYTGGYMEFGYWKRDQYGSLNYFSLVDKVQKRLIEDEQFWRIVGYDQWVLFRTLDRIYIYNTADETFEIIEARTKMAGLFLVNDQIFFQTVDKGLFKFDRGDAILISDDDIILRNTIVGIFDREDQILIVTDLGEFYEIGPGSIDNWNIPTAKTLKRERIYCSLQLSDGTLVLGTISNGIVHLDATGRIIRSINQIKGLINNTVLAMYEDVEGNLWLAMDNGISNINLNSPFREYIDKIGKLGAIYSSVIFQGNLYLGTNQGLFYKDYKQGETFDFIPETAGQVWTLKVIGNTLFCGHNSGTFVINGNTAELVSDYPGTWNFKAIEGRDDLILQGNYSGFSILQKKDGRWKFRNKVEGFDISSRFFEYVNSRQIIVNHEQRGLFRLNFDEDFRNVQLESTEPSKGIGTSLLHYQNDLLYGCSKGVFKFDNISGKFLRDSILSSKFYSEEESIIGILTADNDSGRLWGFSKSNIIVVSPDVFKGEMRELKIPVPTSFRTNMGVFGFESITPLQDDLYLIGKANGYVTLDLNEIQSKGDFYVTINTISKKHHNKPDESISLFETAEFKFEDNDLSLAFGVPEFNRYSEVYYQYKLEGLWDDWSNWMNTSEVRVTNLPYGEYTFLVRAKMGDKLSANTATYQFVIKKPGYLSNKAIFAYVVLALIILSLIHMLNKRYYKKQQMKLLIKNRKKLKRKKLRAQKKLIQLRNEQLQVDVESKNRELAVSTMSLIKKNEFLNSIKKSLKEKAADPQIRDVIRTIDRNINNESDWNSFEEAFNNADKDFLKKIKKLHKGLTSNDLRLCAYLRLNLSSKEIAPLLNISVRSVEVKRYRLRKKMRLPHEVSLTTYILSL